MSHKHICCICIEGFDCAEDHGIANPLAMCQRCRNVEQDVFDFSDSEETAPQLPAIPEFKMPEPINLAKLLVDMFFAFGNGLGKALMERPKRPRRQLRDNPTKRRKRKGRRAGDRIIEADQLDEKD